MARSFDLAAEYPGSVAEVHSALSDRQYWLSRLADSGADDAVLDALTVGAAGGLRVATTQVLRADRLPGLVTQLHRGDLRITRQEVWSPVTGGTSTATIAAAIPGAPVSVTGSGRLQGTATGSKADFRVEVEVKIPLVGGKVEGFIGTQLVELLVSEQRFTSSWIARD
ncbi:DUF2505 domain-containing protein [Mycobacterium sp. ACS4331]|uniref:DUF2505 domain-containing protein n=1 Tax=Mycobacterium sp. ACS4331 TaxID=1834121 RepID=UPI0007FC5E1C|nr:DUF2505 domain-containing protein [Mycobacterium sp. ACS4331]OBF28697.1 hypothetical protein A5727_25055 [Mycobacterium sp. ACS4331]